MNADVYSDERAKTLLLSLKGRLDTRALNDICLRLADVGLHLEQPPQPSFSLTRFSRLECAFAIGDADSAEVNKALECAFEFYDCFLEQISYDHGIEPENITVGGQSFHRLVRRHSPRVSIVIALP